MWQTKRPQTGVSPGSVVDAMNRPLEANRLNQQQQTGMPPMQTQHMQPAFMQAIMQSQQACGTWHSKPRRRWCR